MAMSPWTVLTAWARINVNSFWSMFEGLPFVVRDIRAKDEVCGLSFALMVRFGKLDCFLVGRLELRCLLDLGGIRM